MRKTQPNQQLLSVVSPKTLEIGPSPPRPLGEHGQSLWNRVQREYRIEDSGGIEILAQICAAVDLAEQLADVVRTEGPMLETKTTRRTHPAVRELVQTRAFVVRALTQLGLNVEAIKPMGRPPRASGWIPPARG
jgi:hypothetical protein